MLELIVLYSILCWHGMWWVLWWVALPLNIIQFLINRYLARLRRLEIA